MIFLASLRWFGQGEKEHMEETGCRRYFKVGSVAGREAGATVRVNACLLSG